MTHTAKTCGQQRSINSMKLIVTVTMPPPMAANHISQDSKFRRLHVAFVAVENELRIGLQKLGRYQLLRLRLEFQLTDDTENFIGIVSGPPVAFAVREALPSLNDMLGIFAQHFAHGVAAVRIHHGRLPVKRHEHGSLLACVGARRVVELPFADHHEAQQHRVDDASRQEQRHQNVIVSLSDLPTNQSADDRGADRAVKDKSADE